MTRNGVAFLGYMLFSLPISDPRTPVELVGSLQKFINSTQTFSRSSENNTLRFIKEIVSVTTGKIKHAIIQHADTKWMVFMLRLSYGVAVPREEARKLTLYGICPAAKG